MDLDNINLERKFFLNRNYGPTIELYQKATKAGYNHILWLIDDQ